MRIIKQHEIVKRESRKKELRGKGVKAAGTEFWQESRKKELRVRLLAVLTRLIMFESRKKELRDRPRREL